VPICLSRVGAFPDAPPAPSNYTSRMDAEPFTGPQVAGLIDSPEIWSILADGLSQIVKAGITATGKTRLDAAAEWCRQFSAMIAIPKPTTP
jgi:hypothetical protein